MAATNISYNGVDIQSVEVQDFRAETVYDESGVVAVGIRKEITFTGSVHNDTPQLFAASVRNLQDRLTRPRRTLTIAFGSDTLVNITPSGTGSTADVDQGPRTRGIVLNQVSGGLIAIVSGTIEWSEDFHDDGPIIRSHSFDHRFLVNETEYVTRVIQGRIKLATSDPEVNPDDFRCHVFPIEAAGFRRISAEFVTSADRTLLSYRVIDQQEFEPYPAEVLSAQGAYVVSINATLATKSLSLSLEGSKRSSRAVLLSAAFDAVKRRFDPFGGDNMSDVTISQPFYGGNRVDVSATATRGAFNPNPGNWSALGLFQQVVGDGNLSASGISGRFRQISAYGSAFVKAAYTAIFDQTTDGNPADASGLAKADTVQIDTSNLVDTDGDGRGDSVCGSSTTIVAAESVAPFVDDEVDSAIASDPIALSDAQQGPNWYSRVEQRFGFDVTNQVVVVPTADPDEPDAVQQLEAPVALEVHEGYIERVGAAPVVPTPAQLQSLSGSAVCLRHTVMPTTPQIAADGAKTTYGANYRTVLRYVYGPNVANFRTRSVQLSGAESADLIEFNPGAVPVPTGPQFAEGAPARSVAISRENPARLV